ncbi:hypothetical protein D9613_002384 [Agrocybe pediades]|uniref:Uncharacterized protein n=1 Tax=Agrocybe pediades TaxID=84607 RepID=A0A8H4R7V4_9AGAR|nr:hypothetical protein D9613_002384 [Agrocybe pediades]
MKARWFNPVVFTFLVLFLITGRNQLCSDGCFSTESTSSTPFQTTTRTRRGKTSILPGHGPWYDYPGGIGYVPSSNLTATIINVEPPVGHHVLYPEDDAMIGSWLTLWFAVSGITLDEILAGDLIY